VLVRRLLQLLQQQRNRRKTLNRTNQQILEAESLGRVRFTLLKKQGINALKFKQLYLDELVHSWIRPNLLQNLQDLVIAIDVGNVVLEEIWLDCRVGLPDKTFLVPILFVGLKRRENAPMHVKKNFGL
jgi:hypothetical protein